MSAIRPNTNGSHDLGTSTHKWGTVHAQNANLQNATITQDLTIDGNLTVNGNQIINNVETIAAVDPLIKLAKDNTGDLLDIGLYGQYVEGESTKYAGIYRDASDNKFKVATGIDLEPTTTVTGGVVGTIVANLEGNAQSASALQTTREIALSGAVSGAVNFNGASDVEITTSIANGTIANEKLENASILFGDTDIDLGGSVDFVGTANQITVAQAGNQFSFSLPSNLILGTITAGHINAQIEGVAAEATKLQTARQISLSGAVSGSVNFDGASDVDLSTSIADGSIVNGKLANNSISVNGTSISLGGSVSIQGTNDQVSVATVDDQITLSLPASINVNAQSASALATTREIALSGAVSGAVNFDGSSDVEITTTIANASIDNDLLVHPSFFVNASEIGLGGTLSLQGTNDQVSVVTVGNNITWSLPASINVNAQSASALQTSREIVLSGAVSGSVGFSGAGDVEIVTSIANGSIINDQLANASISVNGTNIALGNSLTIQGTVDQVSVATVDDEITLSLPATINTNAQSASALATAREIALSGAVSGAVNFDGSSDVEITTTIANASIVNDKLANSAISFNGANISLGGAVSIGGTADQVDVASVGGAYTISLPENILVNAQTASSLLSPRNIAVDGAVQGDADFDGSANITITTTIPNGSIGNTQLANSTLSFNGSNVSLGGGIDILGTANEIEVSTVGTQITVGLPDTISADLAGNADTSTLATQALSLSVAREIALGGDLSGAANFDGSSNISIVATIGEGVVENTMLEHSSISFNGVNVALGGSLSVSAGANLTSSLVGSDLTLSIDGAFSGRLDTAEGAILELDGRLDTAEGNIVALQGDMTTAQGNITSLQGDMTTAQGNIVALQGNMTTAQGDITALDGRLDTAEGNITTLQGQMTTAQGDISDLETSVGGILTSKGQAGGIATLDLNGLIPQSQLPSIALTSTYAVADLEERDALTVQAGDIAIVASETKTYVYTQDNTWLEILSPTFSSSFQALQDEIDAVELGAGLGNSGTYTADGTTTYLTLATSLKDADKKLDQELASVDGRLTTAEGSITLLQGDLGSAQNDITSLQGDLGTAQNDIIALDTRMTSVEGVNTTQNTNISTLQGNVSSIRVSTGLEGNLTYNPNNWSNLGLPSTGANASHYLGLANRIAGAVAILDQKVYEAKSGLENGAIVNDQLANSSISVNGGAIALGDSLTIEGSANEVEVSTSGSTVSVGLPQDVTISRNLTVANNITCQGGNLVVEDGSLTVYGGITAVGGNLSVNGGVITSSQANFSSLVAKFVDPLLSIGYDNASATADLGFYVKDSSAKYQGLVSDTSDSGKWKLLKNLATDPGTNNVLDLTGSSFADIKVGGLESSTLSTSGVATLASAKIDGSLKTTAITTNTNATYNITSSTHIMLVNSGSTGTLPQIVAGMEGLRIVVKCKQFGTSQITVACNAADTIDGTQPSFTLFGDGCPSVELLCDGATWWILNKHCDTIVYPI